MADDEEEIKKYVRGPSQILNSLKELQRKEEYFFMRNSKKTFIELEKELKSKNTYFGKTKIPEVYKHDCEVQDRKDIEKLRNKKELNQDFCKKCPVFKNHCPHVNPRTQIKDKYHYPLTTYSGYGWLPEFDNFKENYRLNQTTKDFYSTTHLS